MDARLFLKFVPMRDHAGKVLDLTLKTRSLTPSYMADIFTVSKIKEAVNGAIVVLPW